MLDHVPFTYSSFPDPWYLCLISFAKADPRALDWKSDTVLAF